MFVLPAHNPPFYGLHERLSQLEEDHLTKLERLHDFCGQPRTVHDCLPTLFGRQIEGPMLGLATGEALAHLRRLEASGRIRRERSGLAWRSEEHTYELPSLMRSSYALYCLQK